MADTKSDIRLAQNWPVSRVQKCLDESDKDGLISFLKERYEERYFQPIRLLKNASESEQGYGFAIMALCSLLIESIQCLRDGLPSTNRRELEQLSKCQASEGYEVPEKEWKYGNEAFQEFFKHFSKYFPEVDGGDYHKSIRNGLLHQAQTKDCWTLTVDAKKLCDPEKKIINRNLFADGLCRAFGAYLKELSDSPSQSDVWQKARRKIWWLIHLSQDANCHS